MRTQKSGMNPLVAAIIVYGAFLLFALLAQAVS